MCGPHGWRCVQVTHVAPLELRCASLSSLRSGHKHPRCARSAAVACLITAGTVVRRERGYAEEVTGAAAVQSEVTQCMQSAPRQRQSWMQRGCGSRHGNWDARLPDGRTIHWYRDTRKRPQCCSACLKQDSRQLERQLQRLPQPWALSPWWAQPRGNSSWTG